MNTEDLVDRRIENLEDEVRETSQALSKLTALVASLAEEVTKTNRKLLHLTGEDK